MENRLALKILLQRDAEGHKGGELRVVHLVRTGVSDEVLLDSFLQFFPSHTPARPVRVATSVIVFTSLLFSDVVMLSGDFLSYLIST